MKRLNRVPVTIAFTALFMGVGGLTAAAAMADDSNTAEGPTAGVGITVTVLPSDPEAAASPEILPISGGSVTGPDFVDTTAVSPAPAPVQSAAASTPTGDAALGGVVYVSGLSAKPILSGNPLDASADLEFTIRNISDTPFSSSARFWVQTNLGTDVGSTPVVSIADLKAGETRVITTTVTGLGQWSLLHAHVTYTPPASVAGIALKPLTRDAFIVVPPVAVGAVGAVGALGVSTFLVSRMGAVRHLFRLRFGRLR